MNHKIWVSAVLAVLSLFMVNVNQAQDKTVKSNGFLTVKGPYLGQKPPGAKPEMFAPEIIFTKNAIHGSIAFYPDGTEIYWTLYPPTYAIKDPPIMYTKQIDERWTLPQAVEFCEKYGALEISISPDGQKMYFESRRPVPDSWGKQPKKGTRESLKVWYVERKGDRWGAPKILDRHINQDLECVSATYDGTLYAPGIKRIKCVDGKYWETELLGPPLSGVGHNGGHPYVEPNETFILYNHVWPNVRGWGIFISFHQKNDSWTQPVNLLEKMGLKQGGSSPLLSPDGKYLFYYSKGYFHWVDASIIEEMKPKELK